MLQALLLTGGGGGGMESDGSSDGDAGVALKATVLLMMTLVLPRTKAPTARRCLTMLPKAKAPINRPAWKATVYQGRARVSHRGAWPGTFS